MKRILSIDILRGVTIAGMILVNDPGDWGAIYAPLRHAQWSGMTPTDLVFPTFMFITGMSMCFSLPRHAEEGLASCSRYIIRRSVKLFLVGLLITLFAAVLSGDSMATLRILGVLQRFAISFLFASLFVISLPKGDVRKWIITAVAVAVLLVTYQLLLAFGNGYALSTSSIVYRVDTFVFGPAHLYSDWLPDGTEVKFDPEGLLGSIASVAHVLIGYLTCSIMRSQSTVRRQVLALGGMALILLALGLADAPFCPIIKKVWTPSYVLVTCGIATFLLMLITLLRPTGKELIWKPFTTMGKNPLTLYVGSEVLAIVIGRISICGHSPQTWTFNAFNAISFEPEFASLLYAVCYVALFAGIAFLLPNRK